MDSSIIYYIISILVFIQSILGIGILVLGTPIMLFLDYDMSEILGVLLPISIFTSFINILIIQKFNYKNNYKKFTNFEIFLDKKTKYYFFVICLPSVFVGLVMLKYFEEHFNFKIAVSIVIFLSLIIKIKFEKKIQLLSNFLKKIIFLLIGFTHGLTNSGGTLLSLFLSSLNKNFKNKSRINITFFYMVLVSLQYLTYLILFKNYLNFTWVLILILYTLFVSLIANYLIKFINENVLKKLIEIFALASSIVLFVDGMGFFNF